MLGLGRHRDRRRRVLPLVAGVLVALVAGVALTVTHHEPRMAVAPRVAIRAALREPAVAQALGRRRIGTGSRSTAIDRPLEHVSFFAHGQLVAEVARQPWRHGSLGLNDRRMPRPVRRLDRL